MKVVSSKHLNYRELSNKKLKNDRIMHPAFELHPCPICVREVEALKRYPKQACQHCSDIAVDKNNHLVKDSFTWIGDKVDCTIDGIACTASEYHFGGSLVIEMN